MFNINIDILTNAALKHKLLHSIVEIIGAGCSLACKLAFECFLSSDCE